MTDALDDHEGTVSIGGRIITNLRFADDIDGLAEKRKNWQNYLSVSKKFSQPTDLRSVLRRPS